MESNSFEAPRRQLKTAKPLFTALHRRSQMNTSTVSIRNTKTSKSPRTLPNLMRGKTLDSSKQNLSYEGYLLKVNSASKIDQKSVVESYLNSLRKEYDKIAKGGKQKSVDMKRMKKQI